MSLAIVQKQIDAIYAKGAADDADIAVMLKAAERSQKGKSDGVSNAEARAVADFFLRIKSGVVGKATPPVSVSERGLQMMNAFFVAHHLPYGVNARPMMNLVAETIKNVHFAPLLDEKPRTGSLQPLRIAHEQVAYVDAVKKQFVLKTPGGFFGPFVLPANADQREQN